MRLTAVSPFGEEFSGEVDSVVLDTVTGRRVVLDGHGDFIGAIDLTEIVALSGDTAWRCWAAYGYVHVFAGQIMVIAQIVGEDQDHVVGTHDRLGASGGESLGRLALSEDSRG